MRAVVIVSGGDAVSPFTTPTEACGFGLAAGNTDTALREHLLARGHAVFTSPAMNGRGAVVEQRDGFGPFGDMPRELPAHLTVDSTGDIDLAGEHLARFLEFLRVDRGVAEVDLVGHSMGGLFSRAAIRVLRFTGSPLAVRSLTTIGTPWQGGLLPDVASGVVPRSALAGNALLEQGADEFAARAADFSVTAGRQVTSAYLQGANGWNAFQEGVLDGIPVTLVAGSHFEAPDGSPEHWPNDGIVSTSSALARDVPRSVLPERRELTFPLTHSIFFSEQAGLDWSTALTWSPDVLDALHEAIGR